jgi:dihydroorotate dehydrogenase electron transfer subunit
MNKHNFISCEIKEVVDEADNVKTLIFDKNIEAKPANFVMAWLPGISEKPFALAYIDPIGITLKPLGLYTQKLFSMKKGDKAWIRGPYGNSFLDFIDNRKKNYLVAGGTGAAPLALLAEQIKEPTVFLGGRSSKDLVFEDRFRKSSEIVVSTNDGSKGIHGMVTDIFDDIEIAKNSQFFVCGPEKMMLAVSKKAMEFTSAENIFCSLEKYMKCSRGICGQCDICGYRVCTDGPVFSYKELMDCKDFGTMKREITGKLVAVDH